jgi:hypothetical protein
MIRAWKVNQTCSMFQGPGSGFVFWFSFGFTVRGSGSMFPNSELSERLRVRPAPTPSGPTLREH